MKPWITITSKGWGRDSKVTLNVDENGEVDLSHLVTAATWSVTAADVAVVTLECRALPAELRAMADRCQIKVTEGPDRLAMRALAAHLRERGVGDLAVELEKLAGS